VDQTVAAFVVQPSQVVLVVHWC